MEQNTKSEARTTIDTMLELIKSKGRIDLNSIAATLGIAPSVVEGWAKVLESGNLVKISYEVGKMYISPVELSKDELQALETKTEQQKFILSEELESDLINIDKLSQSLRDIQSNMASFEQNLKKGSPDATKKINELSQLYSRMKSYQSNIDSIKKGISSDYDSMEKRFNEMMSKLNNVATAEQKINSGAPIDVKIQESINNARSAIQELEVAKKNVSQTMDNMKKDLENQIKQENARLDTVIKQSHEQLENALKELQKQAGSYKGEINELKQLHSEEEQLTKKLNQQHAEFNSNYAKLEQSLKEATAKFSPKYDEALAELNKAMEGAGSLGELIKNMSDLKTEITDLGPKLNDYKQELQKLKDQTDAIIAAKNLNMSQKDAKLSELKEKHDKVSGDMKNKKSKISDTLNNIDNITKKMAGKKGGKS